MEIMLALLKGFSTSGGLIIAIGAQNAFVIRQGLKGQHLFLTAFVCALIDAILITFGVIGFGHYISEYPMFLEITKYFAALFLFLYGIFALRSAFKHEALKSAGNGEKSIKRLIVSLLAFSLLNPHVYLDTVILLGSIAAQQPAHEQMYFGLGAIAASFVWFFSITFGAQYLAPLFQKEISWRIIDGTIAIIMWLMALSILHFF